MTKVGGIRHGQGVLQHMVSKRVLQDKVSGEDGKAWSAGWSHKAWANA